MCIAVYRRLHIWDGHRAGDFENLIPPSPDLRKIDTVRIDISGDDMSCKMWALSFFDVIETGNVTAVLMPALFPEVGISIPSLRAIGNVNAMAALLTGPASSPCDSSFVWLTRLSLAPFLFAEERVFFETRERHV
jgi:hypothetical protein